MDEPTPGLTINEAAQKLYEGMMEEESPKDETPEVPPSEEVENTIEASEEVEETPVEEPTPEAETEEKGEVDQFLTDLNDHFREDKSHFDSIVVPTKVNGVEGETTLSELLANYQIGEASTERLESLKADRAAFEAERQTRLESFNEQLNQAAGLVQGLEKRYTEQFEDMNWAELRETDPAEYAAKKQEQTQIEQQLNGYKQEISSTYNNQLNTHYQEILNREASLILDRIPEWSDTDLAQKEKTGIREYLLNQEFSPGEIDGAIENGQIKSMGLVDSRLVKLARKAMLFDSGQKAIDLKTKKVKKLPKVMKPGKPETQGEAISKQRQAKRAKLRKSGRVEDLAALIYDEEIRR